MIRFEAPTFVYNARNHIMDLLIQEQNILRFLVLPEPLDENVRQFLKYLIFFFGINR